MKPTMFLIFFLNICVMFGSTQMSQQGFHFTDDNSIQNVNPGDSIFEIISDVWDTELVKLQLYYETLCPFSITFYTGPFMTAVEALNKNLDISVYPYGNAVTTEKDGHIEIKCQHGPPECYGNMQHACSLDIVKNFTLALEFNSCLMEKTQELDADSAADLCGTKMNIDFGSIIKCAKSDRGLQLLKHYGDMSRPPGYGGVPYLLVNGKAFDENVDLVKYVCKLYHDPPSVCNSL